MAVLRLVALVLVAGLAMRADPQTSDQRVIRTPSMPQWKRLHKVDAEYPSVALQRRIQGTVRFNAIIGKDGYIERLRLISGHPLLVPAAREAARQWIYRPTLLDGQPVRVITQIEVPFQLDPYGNPLRGDRRKPH